MVNWGRICADKSCLSSTWSVVEKGVSYFRLNENLRTEKVSRVISRNFLLNTMKWTWKILVEVPQKMSQQHWVMAADGNDWLRRSLPAWQTQALLCSSFSARTNILSISMNSLGHKYIIRRQEPGCGNNLPCSLAHFHIMCRRLRYVLTFCHLRCAAKNTARPGINVFNYKTCCFFLFSHILILTVCL